MRRHHISHRVVDNPVLLTAALSRLTSSMSPGDAVLRPDGQLIGYYCGNLTDAFDRDKLSMDAWAAIISQEPTKVAINPWRHPTDVDYTTRCFGERTLILKNGERVRQVLINAIGEPTWVNIHPHGEVLSAEAYRARYIQEYRLTPLPR